MFLSVILCLYFWCFFCPCHARSLVVSLVAMTIYATQSFALRAKPPFCVRTYVRTKRSFVCEALYAKLCMRSFVCEALYAKLCMRSFLCEALYAWLCAQKGGLGNTFATRDWYIRDTKLHFVNTQVRH